MRERKRNLVLPPILGEKPSLQRYNGELDRLIGQITYAIKCEVFPLYRRYERANDSLLDELIICFTTLRNRFASIGNLARTAETYIHENANATLKRKNNFIERAGFRLQFKPSERVKNILLSQIEQNVQTIKTIPQQYLDRVEKQVVNAAMQGWNHKQLVDVLERQYDITRNRAKFIAISQQKLAVNAVDRQTSLDAGLNRAMWWHIALSSERYPRFSHVQAWQQRRIFDLNIGCEIDGEFIQPGQLFGCQCTARTFLDYP